MASKSFAEIMYSNYLEKYPGFPLIFGRLHREYRVWPDRCYVPEYISAATLAEVYPGSDGGLDFLLLNMLAAWSLNRAVVSAGKFVETSGPEVTTGMDVEEMKRFTVRCPYIDCRGMAALTGKGDKPPFEPEGLFVIQDTDGEDGNGDLVFALAGYQGGALDWLVWDFPLLENFSSGLSSLQAEAAAEPAQGASGLSPFGLSTVFLPIYLQAVRSLS